MPKQSLWTRRAVLRLGWAGIIASAVLTVQPLMRYLSSKEDRLKSPLVIYNSPLAENSGWQSAAAARVWVKRDALGVMAMVATCTHLGCEVNYHADKKEWICPCHASVYDEEGRPVSGPAPRALARVAVDLKPNGSLLINTSKQVGMDTRA
ncbi:ubiquinol-cytochrome c reductase iron-sulfur subunit [Desulfosporosinus orientis]|nr:ubiquinol-cytochrome c reductase iron-sulfur subunit [Desulfosporosinus orientis]